MLLVAAGERLGPALRARLKEHGLQVEECSPEGTTRAAFVAAPELIVLCGTAAEEGGLAVLSALAAHPSTAALPVVLVGDQDEGPSSFRHGVVAVVARTASADALARRIAEIAHELPERSGEAEGAADVEQLVELLAESLRSGILSLTSADGGSAQVVLRADRPGTEALEQLVERLRPLARKAGKDLRFEFHESPTGRLRVLDLAQDGDEAALAHLADRHVLVIEQNPSRADVLAQGLRAHGATVAVADGQGRGLELARELMPDIVIVDGSAIDGWALEALRRIRRDPSLRWASLLLVDAPKLWRDERRPDTTMLASSIDSLLRPDRDLAQRVREQAEVGTRLEVVGPVRTLRALVGTKLGLRLKVQHPGVVIEIDLSDGLVAGAVARAPSGQKVMGEGPAALATFVALVNGRVQIEHAEAPRTANIMAPLDDALGAAAAEPAASVPSLLAPPSVAPPSASIRPSRMPQGASDVAGLVNHLEQLLGELRHATEAPLPAAEPAAQVAVPPAAKVPRFADDEPEDVTARVDPGMFQELRRRLRRSSQRMRALSGEELAKAEAERQAAGSSKAEAAPEPPAPEPPKPAIPRPGAIPKPVAKPAKGKLESTKLDSSSTKLDSASTKLDSASTKLDKPEPLPKPAKLPPRAVRKPEPGASADVVARPAQPPPARPKGQPTLLFGTGVSAQPIGEPSPATQELPAEPEAASAPEPRTISEPGLEPIEDVVDALEPVRSVRAPPPPPPAFHPVGEDIPEVPPVFEALSDPFPPSGEEPLDLEDASEPAHEPRPVISEVTPVVPRTARGPGPGRALLLAGLGVVALAGLGVGVWALMRAPSAPPPHRVILAGPEPEPSTQPIADSTPTPEAGPAAVPARVEEPGPVAAPVPAEEPGPVAAPVPVPAPVATPGAPRVGPAPSEPVEGRDADFDLARLGITPVATPPAGRRALARQLERTLRDANQARLRGELDQSERIYREVLALDVENVRAAAGLSRVHLERGEPAEAILWAQRLVRLRPTYGSNWVLLGDALRAGGNDPAARRAYLRGTEEQPDWEPAQARLAEMDSVSQ